MHFYHLLHHVQVVIEISYFVVHHFDLLVFQQLRHFLEQHQEVFKTVFGVVADKQVHAVHQQFISDHFSNEEFSDELNISHDFGSPTHFFL